MAFRLFIDEVGHDDLGSALDERYRYLSLSGVIMSQSYDIATATPGLNKLKADIFNIGPDDFLCLHRKDIVQKKGPFGILTDETVCEKFDEALLEYLANTKFRLLTAVIDKVEMMKRLTGPH